MSEPMHDLLQLFYSGSYAAVVQSLDSGAELASREAALLGIALLRMGELPQATLPLASAMALGDLEAAVEYGNLLRVQGRYLEASRLFAKLLPLLNGDLRLRTQRWYGLTMVELEDERGIAMVEQAYQGYLERQDEIMAARLALTLAAIKLRRSDLLSAEELFVSTLPVLQKDTNLRPYLVALGNFIDIQIELEKYGAAQENLFEALKLSSELNEETVIVPLEARQATLKARLGDAEGYITQLKALLPRALAVNLRTFRVISQELADHLSRLGRHASARQIMDSLFIQTSEQSAADDYFNAHLARRRGDLPSALHLYLQAAERFIPMNKHEDIALSKMFASVTLHDLTETRAALDLLTQGLGLLQRLNISRRHYLFRKHEEEWRQLLATARQEPQLSALLETVNSLPAQLPELPLALTPADVQVLELNILGDSSSVIFAGQRREFGSPFGLAPKVGRFRVETRLRSRVQHWLSLPVQGTG